VYNWGNANNFALDVSKLIGLNDGDLYEVRDAQNYYGSTVAAGTFNRANGITLPLTGLFRWVESRNKV
jgi:hypothetical protein